MTTTCPPGELDITIWQGATWRLDMMYLSKPDDATPAQPVPLDGYTGRMQIRATRGDGITRKVEYDQILAELSTAGGGIVLTADSVEGKIRLEMSAEDTAALLAVPARYDLELTHTDSGEVVRLLMGEATISEEVTRG